MRTVFADAYDYVALLNRRDAAHQQAVELSQTLRNPILTTEWVLTEVADAMTHVDQRGVFLALHQQLIADATVTIVPASHGLFLEGLELFGERADKNWGLTDCISFVVMLSRGLTEALTCDHHFEQAGFTALLK